MAHNATGRVGKEQIQRKRAVLVWRTAKNPDDPFGSSGFFNPGNYLVSHKVALAVPSALRGLTSVFGMGTGVTLSVRSPENLINLLEILKSQIPKFLHMKKF
jgi:hypothetical protein